MRVCSHLVNRCVRVEEAGEHLRPEPPFVRMKLG